MAYHPALIYVDTLKYLYGASPGSEPLAYQAVLRLAALAGDLGTVAAIQHVLGLAMAVVLYVVLLRRGAARWLAALAVAPVLLDAYQIQMEQTIMPDVWFEALIVAGLAVLLWRPEVTIPSRSRPAWSSAHRRPLSSWASCWSSRRWSTCWWPAGAGPSPPRPLSWWPSCCRFWATAPSPTCAPGTSGWPISQPSIGRLVAAADCATLKLPAAARPLCPTPAEQAMGPDWLEHSGQSPLFQATVPPGTRGRLVAALGAAIRHQQPVRVAAAIARDSLRLFALTRGPTAGVTPISRWQFQSGYPTYPPWTSICPAGRLGAQDCLAQQHAIQKRVAPVSDLLVRPGGTIVVGVQTRAFGPFHASPLRPSYGGGAQVDLPLAAFLRSYQLDGGYTPGPLLALLALAAVAGSVLALIRRATGARGRRLALACLLFTATAATVLLPPDVYEFSWRYQLPAVITLVPAGVLGISTLLGLRDPEAGLARAPARPAAGSSAGRRRRRAAVTAAACPGRVTARRCGPSGAAWSRCREPARPGRAGPGT